jgi:hypothetical protein
MLCYVAAGLIDWVLSVQLTIMYFVNRIHIHCSAKPPLSDVLHVYAFVCMFALYFKYFLNIKMQYIRYESFTERCNIWMCGCMCMSMLYCKYFVSRQGILCCTKPTLTDALNALCLFVCMYVSLYIIVNILRIDMVYSAVKIKGAQ